MLPISLSSFSMLPPLLDKGASPAVTPIPLPNSPHLAVLPGISSWPSMKSNGTSYLPIIISPSENALHHNSIGPPSPHAPWPPTPPKTPGQKYQGYHLQSHPISAPKYSRKPRTSTEPKNSVVNLKRSHSHRSPKVTKTICSNYAKSFQPSLQGKSLKWTISVQAKATPNPKSSQLPKDHPGRISLCLWPSPTLQMLSTRPMPMWANSISSSKPTNLKSTPIASTKQAMASPSLSAPLWHLVTSWSSSNISKA